MRITVRKNLKLVFRLTFVIAIVLLKIAGLSYGSGTDLPDLSKTKPASTYKALLLDLDDTLLEYSQSEVESLKAVHEQFYREAVDQDVFVSRFYAINKIIWKQLKEGIILPADVGYKRFEALNAEYSISSPPSDINEFYGEKLVTNSRWLPGAEVAVKRLQSHFRLGIVTNGFSKVQRGKHALFKMEEWVSAYIISEEIGSYKPDKKIFEEALTALAVLPHEVLMVGDSLSSDYKGALNIGIDFCWVNSKNVSLPGEYSSPKYTVHSVAELCEFLILPSADDSDCK